MRFHYVFKVYCDVTTDGGDLIGGKPGSRTPQLKKHTHKINLDINAMTIASLTVLNGRVAILSSQTAALLKVKAH